MTVEFKPRLIKIIPLHTIQIRVAEEEDGGALSPPPTGHFTLGKEQTMSTEHGSAWAQGLVWMRRKREKYIALDGNRPIICVSSIMLPHQALVQDLPVHILVMNLYIVFDIHSYVPQHFLTIFGPVSSTTTDYFPIFSMLRLTTLSATEIRPA
jgi:hypothetical protein